MSFRECTYVNVCKELIKFARCGRLLVLYWSEHFGLIVIMALAWGAAATPLLSLKQSSLSFRCSTNPNNNNNNNKVALRTCKNCKTQFDPALNHLRACRFHTAHFGAKLKGQDDKIVTNIGAIIDVNSRIGKQQKAAMEIAAANFNIQSDTHELILHFRDSGRDPFRAAFAAADLVKEQKVQVVVGMETWQEVITVADVVRNNISYNSDQIPVISFAAPTIAPPLIQRCWPFLIRMASDSAAQMKCIGDIVSEYNWKRVVVIYEDDGYGGGVGRLALLSETLRNVGSKVELRVVLPRLSESTTDLDELEELLNLTSVYSRAFIVLQSSLPTVTALFKVARRMGLVGADSAWIITESVASLLGPQGNYDMEGTLGIKTYYERNTNYDSFQKDFHTKYSEEGDSMPGIYALRAFDVISIINEAIRKMSSNATGGSLQKPLSETLSNYMGLSGKMQLKEGEVVLLDSPRFRIISIVGGKTDAGIVTWPGNLTVLPQLRPSKGWAMPTRANPLKILLPTYHKNFVRHKVNSSHMGNEGLCSESSIYEGLSVEIFCKVLHNLSYPLPHVVEEFNESTNASYNDMVEFVYNKTYDAVVGDLTVLADRIDKVDFTQPYIESGLSLIVPDESNESTWMFMKPFTWHMWAATCGILIYTMLIIWFLEGPYRGALEGPWYKQIATATWFTFSSLFFAHREKITSNLTRVVFVVWLFVVLILNSSYTANLSSMLTIQRLSPNVTTIELLRTTKSLVGCDDGSFVRNYLEKVLEFNSHYITTVGWYLSPDIFINNKNLSAVFIEVPYAEVFMDENCDKKYTNTKASYSFGGFSFAFQRGSPIARDFSKAFLQLLQDGTMKDLQEKWLRRNKWENKCLKNANSTSDIPDSLTLESFWGIFVISGAISTFCLLSFAIWKTVKRPREA